MGIGIEFKVVWFAVEEEEEEEEEEEGGIGSIETILKLQIEWERKQTSERWRIHQWSICSDTISKIEVEIEMKDNREMNLEYLLKFY